jgi:hypothetical protein
MDELWDFSMELGIYFLIAVVIAIIVIIWDNLKEKKSNSEK